jgi:hypothetical protein
MTEAIVNYLNLKLETVGRLGVIHCLAELRSDGTTTVPYVYSGTGQVVPINIDGGNLSYWRMDNPIRFEPIVGKYGVSQMSGTYDLRLVVVARRKDSTVDDAFMPTRLAEDIANQITGSFPDLKLLLKAQSVSIRVNSIDTNIPKIWGEEFTATQVNDLNYTRAIMALSVSVTVIGSRDCWQNECDIDPNILHIFDFCNPNVVAELTPTQVACLEDALCEPCADVTIDINGVPFDTVPSGGTLDIPVISIGSNPVGSQSGADYVIANNATYINAVQVTDQAAEQDAFIAVELDGSPSGTWNAGTQTWEVTSPPCADGNIELNGVQVATVASGGTENIDVYNTTDDDTLVPVDPVGVLSLGKWIIGTAKPKFNGHSMAKIKAEGVKNYSIRLDGVEAGAATNDTTWNITSAPCSPVTFQINAVNKESITSGSTFNLITKLDGAVNSGTYDAGSDTLEFTSAGGWVRPSFWPTLPTITAASQAGYILNPVYENRLNRFTCQIYNNAAIDWGDGTTSAPTTALRTKVYTYSTLSGTVYVDAQTGENYKFVTISITASGGNIAYVDFTASAATSPLNAPSYAVDYNLSFPNATTFTMGQLFTREPRMVQILRIWALGTIATMRIGNSVNLRILQLPATMSGSLGAFAPRIGACQIGNVNFGTATGLGSAFAGAMVLSYGNLIANSTTSLGYTYSDNLALEYFGTVTANACTTITFCWSGNFAMKSIGLLTLPLCSDYSYAFNTCYALNAIRVANAANCTSTTGMIQNCYSLQVLDMPNLTRGVNFSNTAIGNYGMNIFATSLGTASGAQTITITGTPFGVLVTAADATALAIRAVMTGKGYTIAN